MKYLFFKVFQLELILMALLFCGCDNNKKITPYLEPVHSVEWSFNQGNYLSKINFLFIIDTSPSMHIFNQTLANNAKNFLKPIFKKYPYYEYNFAITQMSPSTDFEKKNYIPLSFNPDLLNNCQLSGALRKQSVLGSYISYRKGFSSESSIENLLCFLGDSIQYVKNRISSIESYFQNLSYIFEKSDNVFKNDFFAQDAFLVLFFISDNWEGVEYKKLLTESRFRDPGFILAHQKIEELKDQVKDITNVRTYGVVLDYEKSDECGGESGGKNPSYYPFHFYEFVKKTKGLIVSLCDPNWGQQLEEVYKDFVSAFPENSFALDKVPDLDSIEVFLNGIKLPNDAKTGWILNLEKLSISLGSDLDLSYYQRNKAKAEDNKLLIRYKPLNLDILR